MAVSLVALSLQVTVVLFANDKTRAANVVLAAGWNSKIYLWEDVTGKDEVRHYRTFDHGHDQDITCMAFQSPQLLVSGDFGGLINVWNIYSGAPFPSPIHLLQGSNDQQQHVLSFGA